MEYAECMRHVLTAVESSELVALLEETRRQQVRRLVTQHSHTHMQCILVHCKTQTKYYILQSIYMHAHTDIIYCMDSVLIKTLNWTVTCGNTVW